jgi:hypothetical protein
VTRAGTPDASGARLLSTSPGVQWVVPALTGSLVALNSFAGEQQRPSEVHRGLRQRLTA